MALRIRRQGHHMRLCIPLNGGTASGAVEGNRTIWYCEDRLCRVICLPCSERMCLERRSTCDRIRMSKMRDEEGTAACACVAESNRRNLFESISFCGASQHCHGHAGGLSSPTLVGVSPPSRHINSQQYMCMHGIMEELHG